MSKRKCTFAGILLALLVLEASFIGILKTDNAAFYLSMLVASCAMIMGCYSLHDNKIHSTVTNNQTHWYFINQPPIYSDPLFDSVRERM
ncbi:MAG: hypothetical protein GXY16_03770 [Syntrophomonadaceae bacterium]|nr:hypothetical protein [Syntrophomonadaceae bacterium]